MIIEQAKSIDIILGEGDVGIGVAIDSDENPRGIVFQQLNSKCAVGADINSEDIENEAKVVHIVFLNEGGIRSLAEGINRFVEKLLAVNKEESK